MNINLYITILIIVCIVSIVIGLFTIVYVVMVSNKRVKKHHERISREIKEHEMKHRLGSYRND